MNQLLIMGYIDPSVMTYAIQAGAGIVIAVGAFVGLYFHKAKKKVSKKLGIDENSKKEVESDDIVTKKSSKSNTTSKSGTSPKSNSSSKSSTPSKAKTTSKSKAKPNTKSAKSKSNSK